MKKFKKALKDDVGLELAKDHGYVPSTCVLNGVLALIAVKKGMNPCYGCDGPRGVCNGKPKENKYDN